MIKAVFIDIDDTLICFKQSAYNAIKCMFEKYNIPFREDIMEIYWEVSIPLWKKVDKKEMTGDELRKIRWGLIFERLGIEIDASPFEKEYTYFLSQEIPLIDGAEEVVKYLSSKYILCAASNAPKGQQVSRLEKAGMLKFFSYVFESGDIGYDKPLPQFFEHCVSTVGIKKEECIMIGDNILTDIEGAKKAGIGQLYFNYFKKEDTVGADYEISSLYQIMDIL